MISSGTILNMEWGSVRIRDALLKEEKIENNFEMNILKLRQMTMMNVCIFKNIRRENGRLQPVIWLLMLLE